MTPRELEAYLHAHIPISAAMGVRVVDRGAAGITLSAPLAFNINHRATVFGGSVSAVAILAAWAWLHVELHEEAPGARLVIQRNTVEYLAPITGDFEARCDPRPAPDLIRFLATLRRTGKARITLPAEVSFEGKAAARFEGDYVALRSV